MYLFFIAATFLSFWQFDSKSFWGYSYGPQRCKILFSPPKMLKKENKNYVVLSSPCRHLFRSDQFTNGEQCSQLLRLVLLKRLLYVVDFQDAKLVILKANDFTAWENWIITLKIFHLPKIPWKSIYLSNTTKVSKVHFGLFSRNLSRESKSSFFNTVDIKLKSRKKTELRSKRHHRSFQFFFPTFLAVNVKSENGN